jgi:predicted amidophosphoribosyltransferase
MGWCGVWEFLSFLIEALLPCECLICKKELRPFEPVDLPVRPAGWPADVDAFFAADLRLPLFGELSVPARLLCAECWLTLEPTRGGGRLAPSGALETPVDVVSPFHENDALLAMVRFLKFSGGKAAAPGLAWWMARALRSYLASGPARGSRPVLVPVPLHPRRERSRGYNQAALLAYGVAGHLGLEVDPGLLVRVRHTKSQSTLPADERGGNVEGAFASRPDGAGGPGGIVLVDDLVTTGETAGACARALAERCPAPLAVLSAGRGRALSKA